MSTVTPVPKTERIESLAAKQIRYSSVECMSDAFKGQKNVVPWYDLTEHESSTTDGGGTVRTYPFIYAKGLPHDSTTGFPVADAVDKMICSIESGSRDDLTTIVLNDRKLENPHGGLAFSLMGNDSSSVTFPRAPKELDVTSNEKVLEMLEVYQMARLRDVPFSAFRLEANENAEYDNKIKSYMSDLNKAIQTIRDSGGCIALPLNADKEVDKSTFLRGSGQDECVGPYLSQLLSNRDAVTWGGTQTFEMKFKSIEGDYMNTSEIFNNIQKGSKADDPMFSATDSFIVDGRGLGSVVRSDALYQFYLQGALQLMEKKTGFQTFNPMKGGTAGITGGGPDVLASVAHVALGALKVAWTNKYSLGLHLRPEVYAHRIHSARDPSFPDFPKKSELETLFFPSSSFNVMDDFANADGTANYLLPMLYPEGSPMHPSWPAGHAVVAGACCTVLKAMFRCHNIVNGVYVRRLWTDIDSEFTDDEVESGDDDKMSIVGEINKLASNVSLGRDWAGVHYRCDGDCGMALGEVFAISYLVDKTKEYHESQNGEFEGFVLEKFDGTMLRITSQGVSAV